MKMKKIFELDEKQLAPSDFSITGNIKMTTYKGSAPCEENEI